MAKIAIIENCAKCDSHQYCGPNFLANEFRCCEKNLIITEYPIIPDWCPLEDAPEKEND